MATIATSLSTQPARRKATREVRRQQLIDATIDCLAAKGFAASTVADVARIAGLSAGIINFHFDSKDLLLVETLRFLAHEYRNNWQDALNGAGHYPAARLSAVLECDFNDRVCTPRKLAAWSAFWAEAQSRPVYQQHCGANDAEHLATIQGLASDLINDGGYEQLQATIVARALDAMLDGLWLDLTGAAHPLGKELALDAIHASLHAFFPRHFDVRGLRDAATGSPANTARRI